jgi:hypothetical protein
MEVGQPLSLFPTYRHDYRAAFSRVGRADCNADLDLESTLGSLMNRPLPSGEREEAACESIDSAELEGTTYR